MSVSFAVIIIASLCNFTLALLVYMHNPSGKVNKWYGFFGFVTGAWVLSNALIGVFPSDFGIKSVYALGALVPVSSVIWVVYFCGGEFKKTRTFLLWAVAFLFFILPYIDDIFLVNIKRVYLGGVETDYGFGFALYSIYQLLVLSFIIYRLIVHYLKSEGIEKTQAKLILIGAFIWILSVSFISFILPLLGVNQYTSLDSPFSFIFLIFTTYAITKHSLFDVKVIATELFTLVLWVILLIKIFFSNGTQDLIINIGIFASVVIVGILLVRGVIKEVRQREQMEKLAKEVEKAYEVEKKANEELEKLDKYKNDFLRQTQHDLRSPLAVLMGYSDLLLGGSYGKLPKKAGEIIEKMQVVVQNKVKDVNNFLDLEQFKQGKGVVSLKPDVELLPILDEIRNTLLPKAQEKGIYLKLEEGPQTALAVNADREKLKAALFNVIDNAVKYTPTGGVTIKLKIENLKLKIIVSDTGIGIPHEKIRTLFGSEFERTKLAEKTASGSGVGLYLAAQIIKLHNGIIWAESEGEGKGSAFYIELPVE